MDDQTERGPQVPARTAEDVRTDPQPGDTWTDPDSGHVWTVENRSMHDDVDAVRLRPRAVVRVSVRVWSADDGGVYAPAP